MARWPDGAVCGYCYQQAKRTRGTCVTCGHVGVLPGRTAAGTYSCRTCSGITLNVDCVRCGVEDELYSRGLCWRCTLADLVDVALAGPGGPIRAELVPLAAALKTMPRASSGLTWIRRQRVHALLRDLAVGDLPLDHAAFDQLPRSRTVTYIRDLLVEHAALPPRDRNLAAFETWLTDKLPTIPSAEHRQIIERFGRWHHLRRLRRAAASKPVSLAALHYAKQSTTVAISFLAWLAAGGYELGSVSQAEIDRWLADGSSTHARIDTFLFWARSHRLTSGLEIPSHHRGNSPILAEPARIAAIRRVLLDDALLLPLRVAAGLVLLLGQPVHRVARMTTDQVSFAGEKVLLRLGSHDLEVPEPFATLLATLHGSRANLQTAAHRESPWLFPGYVPGRHINEQHLAEELREHGAPPLAARSRAWQQLARHSPSSVLADAIGISPVTAMKHAQLAGADYLRYDRHEPRIEAVE